MLIPLQVEVELGEPRVVEACRWASVMIGGVAVYSEVVYDTDESGERTEEMARRNILNLFGSRLRRVLEDDE